MSTGTADPQGSKWRRWDPHVHLPGTLLNDQFGSLALDEALAQLATEAPTIEAIGVTDYLTTATFRRVAESPAASAFALVFPNVELRLDIPTAKGRGVNLHLLADPEDVDELDRFVEALEFVYRDRHYRCSLPDLERLGTDFTHQNETSGKSPLTVGVEQFKVGFDQLAKRIRNDEWARRQLLVGVAGSSTDGSSGVRMSDGSFAALRQRIERTAHIIFSSTPQQIEFWQGRGDKSLEQLEETYGGPKLCLHGSDAHSPDNLGRPDLNRFTWLKGDASFGTLKLACLSPTSRSHIGVDSPAVATEHGRVANIAVPGPEWFVNGLVPINPGLVAIIGSRGSGKTALADLIAAAAGSQQPFVNRKSFISRAGRLLHGSLAQVEWTHGEINQCSFSDGYMPEDEYVRPVQYLSQQFVEDLCAADGLSSELLEEIERVVFNSWPKEQRLGASDFQELLDLRLASARSRQAAELEAIYNLSDSITDDRMLQDALPAVREELKQVSNRLAGYADQIAELTKSADPASAARLAVVGQALDTRRSQLQALDRRRTALSGLGQAVQTVRGTTAPQHHAGLRVDYLEAGLTEPQWEEFRLDFVGTVDATLAGESSSVEGAMAQLLGDPNDTTSVNLDGDAESQLGARTVTDLTKEQQRLQALVGLDTKRIEKLRKATEATSELRERKLRADARIELAESAEQRIDTAFAQRFNHYQQFFDSLLEEERQLSTLYEPLSRLIEGFGGTVTKLRFAIHRVVDVARWAAAGEELLDLRREGPFRHAGSLARLASDLLLPAWQTGSAAEAEAAIRAFVTEYSKNLKQHRPESDGAVAQREWERAIAKWIYGTDHISLQYDLQYEELGIARLSPGSRGIVLLLLYLAVDQAESDPLIIDQPEENLDPESVYSELVQLFREAAKRRQIIMVTHNANLVVNTDVDQVIVAHCGTLEEGRLPLLSYQSGGLENPVIRKAVCEVLEGGAEAFRQRARRLGLDLVLDRFPDETDATPEQRLDLAAGDS